MIKKIFLPLLLIMFLFTACGHKKQDTNAAMLKAMAQSRLEGDRSVYGLACEGCTDSVVVLLPEGGGDPVKYNVIEATRRRKVLGKLKTGDWICVVPNAKDSMVADIVVDLDQLRGIWCYIVMPKMRDFEKMPKRLQTQLMNELSDSIKETFMIPREYGFYLKRHWVAQSVGYVQESNSLAEESPVVYPPLGYFSEWHILNGNFVMTSGTPHFSEDGKSTLTDLKYDTCSIDYLGNDSLVLTDRYGSRSYYRKDNLSDVNKKARAIAAMRSKQALQETKQ